MRGWNDALFCELDHRFIEHAILPDFVPDEQHDDQQRHEEDERDDKEHESREPRRILRELLERVVLAIDATATDANVPAAMVDADAARIDRDFGIAGSTGPIFRGRFFVAFARFSRCISGRWRRFAA